MIKNKRLIALFCTIALILMSVAPALGMPDIIKVESNGQIVQYNMNDAIQNSNLLADMNAKLAQAFEYAKEMIGLTSDDKVIDLQSGLSFASGYADYESKVKAGTIDQGTDLIPNVIASIGGDGSIVYTPTNPEATITALTPVDINTVAGTAPVLPDEVTATMSDTTTQQVVVTWDAVPQSSYATAGSFIVYGTVAGTTIKAQANVTVNAEPAENAAAIDVQVSNAIPKIKTEFGKALNNVVLLNDTAVVAALVTDEDGTPVPNKTVTFNINSAETYSNVNLPHGPDAASHKYVAAAKFDNSQKTITAVTGADGIATANMAVTITPNEVKTEKEIMTDKYASTEVTYNAAVSGILNTGAVSFATFGRDRFGNDVDVRVTNADADGADPIVAHTLGLYPFSDEGTRSTLNDLHDIEYAFGQTVSGISGSPDNTLQVTAELDLNVYTSLVDSDIQGNKTLPLTGSLTGIKPNQTNVYTEDNLIIPDRVNYASLHFNSLSISRGTEVTVYFVPDLPGFSAPTTVDTTTAAQSLNGHYTISGMWAKTYAVAANADSFVANNFYLQVPASLIKGQIYVVTQAPGQIDPATDIGYQIDKIDMNYGALASLFKADVGSYVEWSQVPRINYTAPQAITDGTEKSMLITALTNAGQAIDANWSYQYFVPVYPMVGDGVVQALDGFGQIVKQWNVPTRNFIFDGLVNQNELAQNMMIPDFRAMVAWPQLIRVLPLAEDAISTPSEATLTQENGVAYINSTHTGPQEIKGTLNIPNIPNNLFNELGADVYSFAQWTPLEIEDGPITVDNVQYALTGQKVVLKAKVTDANGNLVQSDTEVAFDIITGDNNYAEVSATGNIMSVYLVNDNLEDTNTVTGAQPEGRHWRYYVQTNTNGIATLTISAPDIASVVAQASAISYLNPLTGEKTYYNVALSDDAGAVSANGELTQINFGCVNLLYVPEQGQDSGIDQNYTPTMDPVAIRDANSSAVVGNQQNFGILASITWPEDPEFRWIYVNGGIHFVQGITTDPDEVDVNGIPFTVTLLDGSVGTISTIDNTVDTIYYNTTGTRDGVTHWTALSDAAGQETVLIAPAMDATSWNNIQFVDGTTQIVDAGTGLVTPVNSLTIPISWRVGMGSAVVTVPSSTADVGGSVTIKVKVTDTKGNPIEGEAVKFTLTVGNDASGNPGTATLTPSYPTIVLTNADGEASAVLEGGSEGEQDGITVVVEDEATGTTLPITNGQQNIVWQDQPDDIAFEAAVPDTSAVPNTIVLTFNNDVAQSTVEPGGSQFEVMNTTTGETYALISAEVDHNNIILTLANSNAEFAAGDYTVTIYSVDNYTVADNYNSVIGDGSDKTFVILAN